MKLIMCTCPEKEADKLTGVLLEKHLVACVNVIRGIVSKYWWKGKLETDVEALLLMKTKPALAEKVIAGIKEAHSYEVPEVIVVDIEDGNADYLNWIQEVTS